MTDPVDHPPHYKAGTIEFIQVVEAFGLQHDSYLFNTLKYILRAHRKGVEQEELRKALNYLHRRVHGRWIHEAIAPVETIPAPKGPPLYYLATPYSKYPQGITHAYLDACCLAARLLQAGMVSYAPIAHMHPIAIHGHIDPLDHSVWLPFDEVMMSRCDELLVARMEGWDESQGIAHEIAFFRRAGKPVRFLNPADLSIRDDPLLPGGPSTEQAGRNL